MRRRQVAKREILPDPMYGSKLLAKFTNHLMVDGKKTVAEKIVYGALKNFSDKVKSKEPLLALEKALEHVRPTVEVKSRRVGGATYQVPIEVRPERAETLSMRWIIDSARKRKEKNMEMRLSAEFVEAYENRGAAVKKREDVHKMADANKAFAHYGRFKN